jgi:GH24 family phage-related lysozyme (muramidase)
LLLSESQLRRIIKQVIFENPSIMSVPYIDEGGSDWNLGKNYEPDQDLYDELLKIETLVPYIYDDKRAMTAETARSLYGEIIDLPIFKKIYTKGPYAYMKGIPYPVTSYNKLKGTATIGVGHAIQSVGEFNKYKQYTLKEITKERPGKKVFGDDSMDPDLREPSPNPEAFLFPKEEAMKLLKDDIEEHTQFKSRITQPITREMFNALASIAFNSGWEKNRPIQKVINLINKKNYKAAEKLILTLATKSKGEEMSALVARRKVESKLFSQGGLDPKSSKA